MALTKAKLMELIDNGDIDVGGGGFSPNILHNADFRINQRGVGSGFVPSYQYTLDRWLMSPNVWINVGVALALPPYNGTPKFIDQRIEMDLRGRTYTISVDLDGVGIKSVVINYPSNGDIAHDDYDGLTMSLVRIDDYDTLRIVNWHQYVEYAIKRVKLELGTVSTLHLDPPMDHAVELAKCKRFFVRLKPNHPYGLYAVGVAVNATQVVYPVSLPCPMRVVPSMTISGALSVSNMSVISMSGSILHVSQSGGFTEGSAHVLFNANDSNAFIDLSSDL